MSIILIRNNDVLFSHGSDLLAFNKLDDHCIPRTRGQSRLSNNAPIACFFTSKTIFSIKAQQFFKNNSGSRGYLYGTKTLCRQINLYYRRRLLGMHAYDGTERIQLYKLRFKLNDQLIRIYFKLVGKAFKCELL
ncbi:hypothetical protein ENBRE01_0129 [Enteropsectra breve]|nr:hypothetical protein ENBRE01_0129 [Enteropsectra breve]